MSLAFSPLQDGSIDPIRGDCDQVPAGIDLQNVKDGSIDPIRGDCDSVCTYVSRAHDTCDGSIDPIRGDCDVIVLTAAVFP